MQISILCQSPHCALHGEAINTVSGIPPEMIEEFIEDWRGENRADFCAPCGNVGVLDDTMLAEEQSNEDQAYCAMLPPMPIFDDKG